MAAEDTDPGPTLSRAPSSRFSVDAPQQTDRRTPQKSFEDVAAKDALTDVEKEPEGDSQDVTEDNYLVEFDGPNDPHNPKNWTQKRRWAITVMMGLLVFTVTFASSIFSVNISVVQEKFDVSKVEATLGVALFVLVRAPRYRVTPPPG